MNARDNILGRIRAAQGKAPTASAQGHAAVASHIGAHALSPRPSLDWDPTVRFRERVLALSSTYDEIGAIEDAPRVGHLGIGPKLCEQRAVDDVLAPLRRHVVGRTR